MGRLGAQARLVAFAAIAFALAVYVLPTEVLVASAIGGSEASIESEGKKMDCEDGLESGQNKYGIKKNCGD